MGANAASSLDDAVDIGLGQRSDRECVHPPSIWRSAGAGEVPLLPGWILREVACFVELGEQCISQFGRSAVKFYTLGADGQRTGCCRPT
jgi:hypothetical protein